MKMEMVGFLMGFEWGKRGLDGEIGAFLLLLTL